MPATNTRQVVTGDAAQTAIKQGVAIAYEVAQAAYGPRSGNVSIESVYGDPLNSHDGVFNLDHLHLADPATNMVVRTVVQASKATNIHVGDGTTAAVILASALYTEAQALLATTTESRMSLGRKLQQAAAQAVTEVSELKIEATPELLRQVAVISASDEAVGSLISDTIQEIGADGGVIIENFGGTGIYNDLVQGFYFRKGFTNAALLTDPSNLESRFDNVAILVCDKELVNVGDIAPILDKCVGAGIRELVLIGTVTTEALAMAIKARLDGHITTTIVDSPEFAALRTLFLDDVALYTGAKVLNGGANANDFTLDMLGEAKVVITEYSTTLLNGDGSSAALDARIAELTEELRVAQSPVTQEAVRTRLGRLAGKIAILRVGGSTPIEQEELKFRVQDAVAALQAAIKDGVVPGGGVVLARLSDDLPFREAFNQPFRALLQNAGRNVERGLWHVQEAKPWHGYDLRQDEEKLVNLQEAGVVDPTLVIKEVISNAASVAAELIKTTVLLPFDNREAKRG